MYTCNISCCGDCKYWHNEGIDLGYCDKNETNTHSSNLCNHFDEKKD